MFTSFGRAQARRVPGLLITGVAALVLVAAAMTGVFATRASALAGSSQTRSVSCHAFEFLPIDSATGSDYAATKRIRAGAGGSGFFTCDPGLPNRAVVQKVQFSVWDGSGSSGVNFCGLYRSGLGASTVESVEELAALPYTGVFEAPGFARLTDTSIQHATVDTTNHAYWLQCQLEQAGQSLGLYGADVIYSIRLADG